MSIKLDRTLGCPYLDLAPARRVESLFPAPRDFSSPYRGFVRTPVRKDRVSFQQAGSRGNAGPACHAGGGVSVTRPSVHTVIPGSTPGRQHCLLTGVVTVEDRGTAPLTPIRASDLSVANDVSARIRQCRETDQLAPVNKTAGTTRYCDDARRPTTIAGETALGSKEVTAHFGPGTVDNPHRRYAWLG